MVQSEDCEIASDLHAWMLELMKASPLESMESSCHQSLETEQNGAERNYGATLLRSDYYDDEDPGATSCGTWIQQLVTERRHATCGVLLEELTQRGGCAPMNARTNRMREVA